MAYSNLAEHRTDNTRYRVTVYLLIGISLAAGYGFLRGSNWHGGTTLHTVMEAVATLLALTVGAMALVRYYSRKNNTFLFIGAGFLGTAFLDGYHAIVTSAAYKPFMPSDLPALIPWSWVASRQFLSLFLFLSWLAWLRERRLGEAGRISEKAVYIFTGIFALLCFGFFAYAPLPRAYYPELFFHRPEEFLPAAFFLAALAGYLHKGDWRHDTFEHWLVLSLIIGVIAQAALMSFSGSLFDLEFDSAHLLKKISYVCVLTGLLGSMYTAFRMQEERGDAMAQARENTEAALAELASHKLVLEEHAIVTVTDTEGIIIYANDKFCQISKYSKEELIGTHHRIVSSGLHPKDFADEMKRSINEGRPWHGEIKNRAKDGSFYWTDTTIAPRVNRNGDIQNFIAIQTDITERKSVEHSLRTNVDILNTTFNNFPGGISVVSSDLVLQAANPAFYRLLDFPEDRFPVGAHYEDVIRFNAERGEYGEGDIEVQVRERVALARKFEEHSFKRIRPGGISLEIKGWPLPEGGCITTYMDITETENLMAALEEKSDEAVRIAEDLREARDAQNQTHEHLLTSINSMRNGFAIWSADDRLVLANEAYRDFFGPIRGIIQKGVKYEDLLNAGLNANLWDTEARDGPAWLQHRSEQRRSKNETERELVLTDGRQFIILDLVLDSGDIVTTVIDATAHRMREKELQNTKQQLEQIAYFDGLTGLANRTHCQKDLVEKFATADQGSKFAIIQIDLDNFKRVNDTLGHAAGDHLLQMLGERLNMLTDEFQNFNPYRWGGDEFIALVERDDNTDLSAICQELNDLIGIPLEFGKSTLRPTVSLGVARYPEDATDLEALMIFADLALYKTKELGRDGYQFFTSEMKEEIDAESLIEQELRVAIAEDQLELYFQPQLNVNDETITGLEALLRWNHPERGVVTPGDFLPVVEKAGLAPAVGRKVFDNAMQAVRSWVDDDVEFGRLAVNLSPQHLNRGTVLDDFFGSMDKHGIEPHLLAVEFLESFLFDDPNADIANILEQLRGRGIHVELDDFGTGYASLSHLSTMPINGLKIDRSFVHQMLNDVKQQGIVSSLISLAKLMDLRVVCEGIETRQQLEAISQIGKCSIQGYFVARPMSFDAITEWIKNERNMGIFRSLPNVALRRHEAEFRVHGTRTG